jgi:hypothetical protein
MSAASLTLRAVGRRWVGLIQSSVTLKHTITRYRFFTLRRATVRMFLYYFPKLSWTSRMPCCIQWRWGIWVAEGYAWIGLKSRDSSVGIATAYRLDCRISIPGGERDFSLLHRVHAALVPTQPPIFIETSVSEGKAAGERSWPFTSIKCRGKEWWSYTFTSPHVYIEQL